MDFTPSIADLTRNCYYTSLLPVLTDLKEAYRFDLSGRPPLDSEESFALVIGALAGLLHNVGEEKILTGMRERLDVLNNSTGKLKNIEKKELFQQDAVLLSVVATGSNIDIMEMEAEELSPVYCVLLSMAKCVAEMIKLPGAQ